MVFLPRAAVCQKWQERLLIGVPIAAPAGTGGDRFKNEHQEKHAASLTPPEQRGLRIFSSWCQQRNYNWYLFPTYVVL